MLAIGFLAHFYISDGVAALLNVSDLGGRIFWCAVKHRDRNHCWQVIGEPAGKENVEAAVLVVSSVVHVSGGMPGIDGGNGVSGSFFSRTFRGFDESPSLIIGACRDLLNRVADAIANIVRPMLVTSIRRLRHQDAQESRGNGHARELQSNCSAAGVFQYA